ncbi:MAG: LamG-like jellyroll fold domain-containing protein [candidate division Zixibacteria bacterium]
MYDTKPYMHGNGLRDGHPLAPGVQAFYPFWKDNSLINAADYNNPGTLVNSPTWQDGPSGAVLDFDGSSQYVDTGVNLDGVDTFSLWLKIKPDWVAFDDYLVDTSDGATGFFMRHDSSTNIYVLCYRTGGPVGDAIVPSQDNEWVSLLLVMKNVGYALYRNGITVGESGGTSGTLVAASTTIKLAASFSGGQNHKSQIETCAIWKNKALTQSDAQELDYDPWSLIRPREKTYIYERAGFVPSRYYYQLLGATG